MTIPSFAGSRGNANLVSSAIRLRISRFHIPTSIRASPHCFNPLSNPRLRTPTFCFESYQRRGAKVHLGAPI